MKTKKISKFEEKYIFNISLTFWRIIIAIGILGAILGVLLLLWGIIPPFKQSPNKEKYPPVVSFSVNELKEKVLPKQLSETKKSQEELKQISKTETVVDKISQKTTDEINYLATYDSLKILFPKKYDAKLTKGHWYYPHGKKYWDYYQRSEYRKWIVDVRGLDDLINSVFKSINAESFLDKKRIIESYIAIVKKFQENERVDVIEALTTFSTGDVSQSLTNIQLLNKSIPFFTLENTKYLTLLANFGKQNPKDGNSFIEFVNNTISNFNAEYRITALETLIESYYNYFNVKGGLNKQIEVTNEFLPMVSEFEPGYQSKALGKFYPLYFDKNAEREQAIRQIDWNYENDMADAKADHQLNKQKKAQVRLNGLYLIGAGLVLIAFLALILVFLSIQKSIRKIEIELVKNN
ncbi:MAG: hypothetical protein Q7J16_00530 [Candidatus Cloacimonadales bacterium]|nr:hypothetical protein [Candidatus Cloacimonadales bacterium]